MVAVSLTKSVMLTTSSNAAMSRSSSPRISCKRLWNTKNSFFSLDKFGMCGFTFQKVETHTAVAASSPSTMYIKLLVRSVWTLQNACTVLPKWHP